MPEWCNKSCSAWQVALMSQIKSNTTAVHCISWFPVTQLLFYLTRNLRRVSEGDVQTHSTASTPSECSWMSSAPNTVSRWERFFASSSPLLLISSHSWVIWPKAEHTSRRTLHLGVKKPNVWWYTGRKQSRIWNSVITTVYYLYNTNTRQKQTYCFGAAGSFENFTAIYKKKRWGKSVSRDREFSNAVSTAGSYCLKASFQTFLVLFAW